MACASRRSSSTSAQIKPNAFATLRRSALYHPVTGYFVISRSPVQVWVPAPKNNTQSIFQHVPNPIRRSDRRCSSATIYAALPQVLRAAATALGFSAATRNNAIAGPSGIRRPCSQLRSVATLTPIIIANSGCDFFKLARIAFTSAGRKVNERAGVIFPRWTRPCPSPKLHPH